MTDEPKAVNNNLNNDQIDLAEGAATEVREVAKSSQTSAGQKAGYHHGDLRAALVAAGEAILDERGVEGFSLREAARRAGVSPGAPAHHFGDAKGLLTAITVRAFDGLADALEAANASTADRTGRIRAQGKAYIAFALANRAGYALMFRPALHNNADPALSTAADRAFNALREAVEGPVNPEDPCGRFPETPPSAGVFAAWSIVHGYAQLALDGAIAPTDPSIDAILDHLAV